MFRPIFCAFLLSVFCTAVLTEDGICSQDDECAEGLLLMEGVNGTRRRRDLPGNITCATPNGPVPEQDYCYYAIDVGDPSVGFKLYFNSNNDTNAHTNLLKSQIDQFCKTYTEDDFKPFPAFMTRNSRLKNGENITVLTDTWVYCCTDCKKFQKRLNVQGSRTDLVVALAKEYIRAMPRTALGATDKAVSPETTCYSEDYMIPKELPIVSTCHSFVVVEENHQDTYFGQMLFNRIPQDFSFKSSKLKAVEAESAIAFFRRKSGCGLSFKKELGLAKQKDVCYWNAASDYYYRYCCCPEKTSTCAVQKKKEPGNILCADGHFNSTWGEFLGSSTVKSLVGKECVIQYQWDHLNETIQPVVKVVMEPGSMNVSPYPGCKLNPNKYTQCPHLDLNGNLGKQEVVCTCSSHNFCNMDVNFGYKSKKIASDLNKDDHQCKYTSKFLHIVYPELFVRDNRSYCPVFYDIAKDTSMNLIHHGNMHVKNMSKSEIKKIYTQEDCNVIEVKLMRDVFKDARCGQAYAGYDDTNTYLPRLVMVCSCAGDSQVAGNESFCDENLRESLSSKFEKFESKLPKCFVSETEFDISSINIAEHVAEQKPMPNRENRYCYQAYVKKNTAAFLYSGSVSSEDGDNAERCAQLLEQNKKCEITKNRKVFCCCRTDDGEPCNRLLITEHLITTLMHSKKGYKPESCHPDVCKRDDRRCYSKRGMYPSEPRENGCISNIYSNVQNDQKLRHLHACELEDNQQKCVAGFSGRNTSVVCCCDTTSSCPEIRRTGSFGYSAKSLKN